MTRAEQARPERDFDFSGGVVCLDLANTLEHRGGERPRELLRGYDDLVAWSLAAGTVDAATAAELRRAARDRPRVASRVVRDALTLREAIYAVFAAAAAGNAPSATDLDPLNAALSGSLARLRVGFEGAGVGCWRWSAGSEDLDRVLWPVARSAAELLTSSELLRVRECGSPTCAWLFLDRSRNASRRWCDMKTCGNRDKARRHYARRRSVRDPRDGRR
jgi:predicted RNA-binding Zn ribbon-like protein